MPTLPDVHQRGTRAQQTSGIFVSVGALYFVTDENKTERWNGSAWESYSDPTPPALMMARRSAEPDLQQQIDELRARVTDLERR